MATPKKKRREPSPVAGTVHSIRCSEELWGAAKSRADSEGVTMTFVLTEILEGYSRGLMDLPYVTKTFTPTRVPAA